MLPDFFHAAFLSDTNGQALSVHAKLVYIGVCVCECEAKVLVGAVLSLLFHP